MLHDAFVAKQRMNPHIAEGTPIEAMLAAARDAGGVAAGRCAARAAAGTCCSLRPPGTPAVRAALTRMGGEFAPLRSRRRGVRANRGDARWAPTP